MTGKNTLEAVARADACSWIREAVISYAYLVLWIATSASVIVYNKYILDNLSFPFPTTLALLHMGLSAALAHAAVGLGFVERPDIPWAMYKQAVLPIGFLYSVILSLSNATYIFLSVSFIQMLKAMTPASVYAVGCIFGTEKLSWRLSLNLVVVITGVLISAYGEVQFVVVGVVVQVVAIVLESVRLTMTQLLLQRQGVKMNPIAALYYVAPCCFVGLLPLVFALEFDRMRASTVPVPVMHLFINSLCAFGLNLASFMLLGRTSALTMNIGGVVKDWLLIAVSASVFRSAVTATSLGGYALAFCGVFWYNMQKVAVREAPPSEASDTSPVLKTPGSSSGESSAQSKIGAVMPEVE